MDCIDLFKKAAAALQTDPRYLELDAARRENDADEELQNMIGEFNLARLDLNNESAKAATDAARVAELNQRVNEFGLLEQRRDRAQVDRLQMLRSTDCLHRRVVYRIGNLHAVQGTTATHPTGTRGRFARRAKAIFK